MVYIKILILVGFFSSFSLVNIASASTLIDDTTQISGDVVWTKSNSPYVIQTTVSVPFGSSLTIEPGVVVKSYYDANITISGTLTAGNATSSEKVYFTSVNDDTVGGATSHLDGSGVTSLSWKGILFSRGSKGTITNAVITRGGYWNPLGGITGGQINNIGGVVAISDSEIKYGSNIGLHQKGGITTIIKSDISDNNYSSIYVEGGDITVQNSKIKHFGSVPGIFLSRASSARFHYNSILDLRSSQGFSAMEGTYVSAENNWWGSPLGPRRSPREEGRATIVSGNASFTPWLTSDPFGASTLPTLSFATSTPDGLFEDDGVQDHQGEAGKTQFTFSVIYTSATNQAPESVILKAIGATTTTKMMSLDTANVSAMLKDGNYQNGEAYVVTGTFPKDFYFYSFVATIGSSTVNFPAISDAPLIFRTGYSNVLFLPGLEASRLYEQNSIFENQLWEPNRDADVEKLFLTPDGISVDRDIYTRDVIDDAYLAGPNIYNSFINQMNELKTTGTINDWKATPYDWRLSLDDILNNGTEISGRIYYSGTLAATSSPYIIQELKRLASTSKTGKVTIVAHSNGGLVTKALTQKLGTTEAGKLIDKIIFVAVPQVGTPQAIGALLHGYDQGLPKDWLPIFLSRSTARTLAENMSSAYNLLPSTSYFTSVSAAVVTFEDKPIFTEFRARYGNDIGNEADLKTFITDSWRLASSTSNDLIYPSVGNGVLFGRAETEHLALDSWTPPSGVSLYEIAGWGEDTLSTIAYKQGWKTVRKEVPASFPFSGTHWVNVTVPAIKYNPKEVIDGDGTVLTPSALWTATATTTGKWWVDLGSYNAENLDRKHADILEVPELRALIQGVITNSISALPGSPFISTTQPTTDPADARLSFILHSPLHLSATDSFGNITNSATTTIPGSRFTRYGEVQVLKVPKGPPVTLNLKGYASGSFTLDVEELDGLNNIVASTTFAGIPSATSTTATISFPYGTLETKTPLLVDYDNNGTTDFTINSKPGEESIFDITPPEARLSFSTSTSSLLVEGIDESQTIVRTTATSTVITDQTGNTTELLFSKFKQEKNEIKLELSIIAYNYTPTTTLKTTLQYEWSTDKQGNLKQLEQKVTIGNLKIEAHYNAKKNQTNIKKKLKEKHDQEHDEEEETKETFSGLRILKLITNRGEVRVDY